jgi:hypothetical protein
MITTHTSSTGCYALEDGKPAPAHLKDDRKRLAEMAQATLGAWRGRRELCRILGDDVGQAAL